MLNESPIVFVSQQDDLCDGLFVFEHKIPVVMFDVALSNTLTSHPTLQHSSAAMRPPTPAPTIMTEMPRDWPRWTSSATILILIVRQKVG